VPRVPRFFNNKMKEIRISLGEEKEGIGAFLVIMYFVFLSIVIVSIYEIPIVWWGLLVGITPFCIFKLTKLRIKFKK
jgi:hypothetical protein